MEKQDGKAAKEIALAFFPVVAIYQIFPQNQAAKVIKK
jgi:hypothetical protein